MFYFIPSWYNQGRQWYDKTPIWSRVYDTMEFDDTINQLKMFQQSNEESVLMSLSYSPQLRYFLHKQDLQGTRYWSFFDDIQNISRRHVHKIDFKQLNWPEQVTFLFSPFIVLVRQFDQTIARIYFAENGNLLTIDYESEGQITESFIFDDRGFLSSRMVYENGKMSYQDYLNENGVWQIREHLGQSPLITINPDADKVFSKTHYQSWEELLEERLKVFSEHQLEADDKIIIASDTRHNVFLTQVFDSYSKIFSFFGNRFDLTDTEKLAQIAKVSDLIVTEKNETREAVLNSFSLLDSYVKAPSVLVLTPFDSRLRLGHSQSFKTLEIYFFMDTINTEKRQRVIKRLLAMMETNSAINLTLVSYDRDLNPEDFKVGINKIIYDEFDATCFFRSLSDSGENQIDESEEEDNIRVNVEVITSETRIISLLDHARLVVDLGDIPDLYTQIASISAGIPQINQVQTEYVTHRKNGWIIRTEEDINKAIHYYFDGLRNWNDSLVYAVEKMGNYTSGKLLNQWKKELMEREYE